MPDDRLALSTRPPVSSTDTDYDAICAAVTATARGRWFLSEYAKRNRNSDTLQVLAAIARMEGAVAGERTQQAKQVAHQEVRIELLEMARTIAQTRAEVAAHHTEPQPLAAGTTGPAAAPDIAAAAERLRQIAWTMRACGMELSASDQVGQIADTILSADAVRTLGDQRAQKLTDVLHYLEHRIDRMLDSHLAATAGAADPTPAARAPQFNGHDRHAAIAAAVQAVTVTDAATVVAADAESPSFSTEKTAAAAATASAAAEIPMDNDVMLTVADGADEPAPASVDAAPEPTAPSSAHSRESGNPGIVSSDWVPACAGTSGGAAESNKLESTATEADADSEREYGPTDFLLEPPPAAAGPLAALMAMSEEERIALFS